MAWGAIIGAAVGALGSIWGARKSSSAQKSATDRIVTAQEQAGQDANELSKQVLAWWQSLDKRQWDAYEQYRQLGSQALSAVQAGMAAGDLTPRDLTLPEGTGARMPTWNRGQGGERAATPQAARHIPGLPNRFNPPMQEPMPDAALNTPANPHSPMNPDYPFNTPFTVPQDQQLR